MFNTEYLFINFKIILIRNKFLNPKSNCFACFVQWVILLSRLLKIFEKILNFFFKIQNEKLNVHTSQPHVPAIQSILLAQSAYAEQACPNKNEQVLVWAPAGCKSHPKSDVHWSSARQLAPNDPWAMQS